MNAPNPEVREIPPNIQGKYDAWKNWASWWNAVHYTAGCGAAALSAISAANASAVKVEVGFLTRPESIGVATAAAICAFILTAIAPQKTAKSFVDAYRHLEKSMALYRLDPSVDAVSLAKAEAEGLDLLE